MEALMAGPLIAVMRKPDQAFIWHSGVEVDIVYQSFRDAFAGNRYISNRLYHFDEADGLSTTYDEVIPNQLAQSSAVVMLLSNSENEHNEFGEVLQGIADADHRIAFAAVFLRPVAKNWWTEKIEPRIEGLCAQFAGSIELWSPGDGAQPPVVDGADALRVARVQGFAQATRSKSSSPCKSGSSTARLGVERIKRSPSCSSSSAGAGTRQPHAGPHGGARSTSRKSGADPVVRQLARTIIPSSFQGPAQPASTFRAYLWWRGGPMDGAVRSKL
jgi:hypothetical protein